MSAPVRIEVERAFAHQRDAAYAWLTDYADDDDADGAGVIENRRVLEREKDRVVLEGWTVTLGVRDLRRSVITLTPPGRYVAHAETGKRAGSVTEYDLVETGREACRLTVTYNIATRGGLDRFIVLAARPLVKRSLERMWDGFTARMARDLSA